MAAGLMAKGRDIIPINLKSLIDNGEVALNLEVGAGDIIVTGSMLAEFEVDPSMPQRAEGQDTGHAHGHGGGHSVGSQDPAPDDRVVASNEGGAIEATQQRLSKSLESLNAALYKQTASTAHLVQQVNALLSKLGN